jgi:hypothetical protein
LAGAATQFFDNNGVPLAGGLIYTYLAGTTTPAVTYTSSTGLIAHSNPIVLDAAGRIATGEVWLTSGVEYKFIVKTSLGVQLGSYDNIPSINDFTSIYADLANTTNPALGDALVGFRQSNSAGNLSGSVGRTVHQKLQESISVKDFGASSSASGSENYTAFTNAIDSAYSSGGATILIPAGIYNISGSVQLRSYVTLIGEGPAATELIFSNAAAFAQTATTQMYAGGIKDMAITAASGNESATAITLTAAQNCVFDNLVFNNFTTGTILKIEGATVTTFDEPIAPLATSNTIFNQFSKWTVWGCNTGMFLFGQYGSTPTVSPAGSSNVPNVVITQNRFEGLVFWQVNVCGINIKGACDTEVFDTVLISLNAPNAIAIDLASDVAYTGNNYVNSMMFESLVLSKQIAATPVTLIKTRWTFGNRFNIEHDIDLSTGVTFFDGASSQSHYIFTKNSGDLNSTSNLLLETIEKNVYHGIDDGDQFNPTIAFASDRTTGIFRGSAGEFCIGHTDIPMVAIASTYAALGGTSGSASFRALANAANRNRIDAVGTPPAGGLVKFEASGDDTNLDFYLLPKGSGQMAFGTHAGTADAPITGFITIKDAAGITRKLAIIN